MTDQEAAIYKGWAPSLLLPKDDPRRRGAEYELREELKGFADGFLELPDPVVTPIQEIGKRIKNK